MPSSSLGDRLLGHDLDHGFAAGCPVLVQHGLAVPAVAAGEEHQSAGLLGVGRQGVVAVRDLGDLVHADAHAVGVDAERHSAGAAEVAAHGRQHAALAEKVADEGEGLRLQQNLREDRIVEHQVVLVGHAVEVLGRGGLRVDLLVRLRLDATQDRGFGALDSVLRQDALDHGETLHLEVAQMVVETERVDLLEYPFPRRTVLAVHPPKYRRVALLLFPSFLQGHVNPPPSIAPCLRRSLLEVLRVFPGDLEGRLAALVQHLRVRASRQ